VLKSPFLFTGPAEFYLAVEPLAGLRSSGKLLGVDGSESFCLRSS
jgi:hypothetical protein